MQRTHPGATINTADLVAMYESGLSLEKIAHRVPMTSGGIRMRLIKAGCPLRPKNHGMAPANKKPIATEQLVERYRSGESAAVIGRSVGLTAKSVLDRLRRAGITRRSRSDYGGQCGPSNANWRGGRWENGSGYMVLSVAGRSHFEHRVVMERTIGRPLKRHEIVHHINGIRDDNRPENLAITTRSKHESRTLIKALQRRICDLESLLKDRAH